jgi:hypothetical protein
MISELQTTLLSKMSVTVILTYKLYFLFCNEFLMNDSTKSMLYKIWWAPFNKMLNLLDTYTTQAHLFKIGSA